MSYRSPVELATAAFGGPRRLARAIGSPCGTACRWMSLYNGRIPTTRLLVAILIKSQEMGLGLTAEQLLWGEGFDQPVEAIPEAQPQLV